MAQDDGQERTEQATPKRLREAREKGQIPRSRELNTMAMMMASAGAFILFGDIIINGLVELMNQGFVIEREHIFDTRSMPNLFLQMILDALGVITPLLIVMVIVAVFSSLAVSGWNFSSQAISFKWEKLDPIKGMKRVFALRGLMELLKAFAKFMIIGAAAVILLWNKSEDFIVLGNKSLDVALADLGNLLTWSFLTICLTLILLALIDVPFQIWDNAKQLKMTRQEIRDEMKQTEGNPEVKARIRQIQREMAQRRMMEAVPKADVVITNPTHYAIALKYDQENMVAPVVIAKGVDEVAANIRAIASSHDISILSAPPLARALYYSTELDQEIPVGLFQAVAQVLAYIFHLKETGSNIDETRALQDLPIPDELKRDG
ncbi:MAG: flagellar biosynthesis protein FlhB [Gammaproteobacteria bacterium]|nr:flagellar biosynthesis protein FlhB [Gammaproteobacteria bacterium]